MIIPVKPDANGNIDIFYEGDENVTQVYFENPDSDFKWALHYLRRGDKRPYNVPLEEADGDLIWTASLADTEKPGTGFAQLVGSAEGQTKHSRPYTVTVRKSLGKPGSVPAAEKAFGDAVAADAASAKRAAEDAEKIYRYVKQGLEDGSFIGPAGPQGPRGEKGEQGVPGAQGEKGDQGPAGPAGADGKDGLDAPQIDDSVVSAENPWSSRRIIEMLCPPIAETGNPVTCYPVAGYPLGVVASWAPTQAGTGDPSPDNIRPISGRDAVSVERCGRNLIKPIRINRTINGIAISTDVQGVYRLQGELLANGFTGLIGYFFLAPGTYSMLDSRVKLGRGDIIITLRKVNADGTTVAWVEPSSPTGRLDSKTKIVASFFGAASAIAKGTYVDGYIGLALISGSTPPTVYTPYRGDTLALALPSTIYGGEVDAVTGDGAETWKLTTLDGNSAVNRYREFEDTDTYKGFVVIDAVKGIDISRDAITSHFKRGSATSEGYYPNEFVAHHPAGHLYLRIEIPGVTSVETFKAYLAAQYAAGTPVQIAYRLAEPVPFRATGNGPIMPLEGETNTIMTDADSVTVTGRADPAHAIAALQAQLAVATQALAETQQAMVDTTAMAVDYIYEQDLAEIGLEEVDDSDNQTDTEPVDVPGV